MLEGFGSEASLVALLVIIAKIVRDAFKEHKEYKALPPELNGGKEAPSALLMHMIRSLEKENLSLRKDVVQLGKDVAVLDSKHERNEHVQPK